MGMDGRRFPVMFDDTCAETGDMGDQHTARLNMPGFSALLKSLPSATLA